MIVASNLREFPPSCYFSSRPLISQLRSMPMTFSFFPELIFEVLHGAAMLYSDLDDSEQLGQCLTELKFSEIVTRSLEANHGQV